MATEVGEPSRAEVQQAVNALYDRAENDTGNFNATRARSGAGRRSGVSLARGGRGSADPSTEAMARRWFDVARGSIGPTVPAVLPADRMPTRPAAPAAPPRVPKELEKAFENNAPRALEPGRRLELEAPERRVPELTGRAVPALPPATERMPAALEPRRGEPKALPSASATPGTSMAAAPANRQASLKNSKEQNGRKLTAARNLLARALSRSAPSPAQLMGPPAAMPQAMTAQMRPLAGVPSQPMAAQPMRPPAAPVSRPGDTAEQQAYRAEAAAAWAGQSPAAGSDGAPQLGGGGGEPMPEAKIMTPGAGSNPGGSKPASVFPTSEFGVAKPAFSFPMPEVDPATGSFILPDLDAAPTPQAGPASGSFSFPLPDDAATTPAGGTPQAGPGTGSFAFPMPDTGPTTPATGTPMPQTGPGTGSFAFPMPDTGPTTPATGTPMPQAGAVMAGGALPSAEYGVTKPPFSFPLPGVGPTTPPAGTPMPQAGYATPAGGTPMPQTGYATPAGGTPVPEAAVAAPMGGFPPPELVGAAPGPGFPASGAGVTAPMPTTATGLAAPMPGMPSQSTGFATASAGALTEPALSVPAPAPAPAPVPAPTGATFTTTGAAYLGKADKALAFARAQIGRPCLPGATGPESYDCSSLTQAAWRAAGVTLPRSAIDQAKAFTRVGLDELRPGDLVFFHDDLSHVGLCTDGGTMIHAPGPGAHIREESILAVGEGTVRGAVRPA
ncbi:NlpC/P60 family protein [Streptomyces sp. NPDC049687]|uniref:C40 family peptidase n=1 Tax=Streptomyces sp. NPDC049687 TaxID=3365596 RepID=UPI0037B18BE4